MLLFPLVIFVVALAIGDSLKCPENIRRFSAHPGLSKSFYECINGEAILKTCEYGHYLPQKEICQVNHGGHTSHGARVSYTSRSNLGFRTQPALGNTLSLGTLYNARTDYIMNGFRLWDQDTINKNIIVQDKEFSNTDFFAEENVFDRISYFDIKASLKLSFLGGLIEVGGSATYLRDGKETENSIRFNMNFDATTHSESIPVGLVPTNKILCSFVKNDEGPTHVISSVTYGMKSVFIFEKSVSENESKEQVGGSLKVAIKTIPSFQIEGSAAVNVSGSLKEVTKNLRVKLYGDVLLDQQPTSYEEAIFIYKNLPQKVKEKPSIIEYQLTPITYYCDKTTSILNEISSNLVDESSKSIGDILELHEKLRTLRSTDASGRFTSIRKNLLTFENELNKFENDFKAKMADILPKIRSSSKSEVDLIKLINEYKSSPFELGKANIFLDKRKREINTIALAIKNTLQKPYLDVTDSPVANDNKCIFEKKFVMLYVLSVLPEENISDKYIAGTAHENNNPWYDNNAQVGEAGRLYREFDSFAKENFGPDHCFQIQLKARNDSLPFMILVFRSGKLLADDFVIPSQILSPVPIGRGYDKVIFKPLQISNKFVTNIAIEFWDILKNGTRVSPRKQIFDLKEELAVTGLDIKTMYGFQIRYITEVGHSVASTETLCLTTPSSPPSSLKEIWVTSGKAEVTWNEPLVIADGLDANDYEVIVKQNTTEVQRLSAKEREKVINGLSAAEIYTVECKIKLPEETYVTSDGNSVKILFESYTTSIDIITAPIPPSAPFILETGNHKVKLQWDVPRIANGATVREYIVSYTKVGDGLKEVAGSTKMQSSTVNSVQLNDLQQGTTYSIKVKVRTTLGSSDFSPATIALTNFEKTELDKFKDSLGLSDIRDDVKHIRAYLAFGVPSCQEVYSPVPIFTNKNYPHPISIGDLEKMPIICPNSDGVLNSVELKDLYIYWYYKYKCCKIWKITGCNQIRDTNTPWYPKGDDTMEMLVPNCGKNSVINNIKFRENGDQWRYELSCCDVSNTADANTTACSSYDTGFKPDGGKDASKLLGHEIKCPDGWGLSKFHLKRNTDKTKSKYQYDCCKYQQMP